MSYNDRYQVLEKRFIGNSGELVFTLLTHSPLAVLHQTLYLLSLLSVSHHCVSPLCLTNATQRALGQSCQFRVSFLNPVENKIVSSFVVQTTHNVSPVFNERKSCFASFKSLHQEFDHLILGTNSLFQIAHFGLKYFIVVS